MENTEQPTPTGAEQTAVPPANPQGAGTEMEKAFDEAWGFMDEVVRPQDADKPATTTEVTPPATPEIPATPAQTQDGEPPAEQIAKEFDISLLDKKIKRHDEELSIKEFITQFPEEATEIIQKGYDYQKSKLEVKEELVTKMKEIETKQAGLDQVLLMNLAYEMEIPYKTEQDFLNDLSYDDDDDALKAFGEYKKEWNEKAKVRQAHAEYANMENQKMVKSFTEEFKDVKLDDVMKEVQQYLNASVGKGLVPFPKDALKVFWAGKNHDKIVADKVREAREDERKQVYLELEGKVSPTVTNTAQHKAISKAEAGGYRTPMDRAFDEAFDF